MPQGIAKKTCDVLHMIEGVHSVVVAVRDFGAGCDDYAALLGRAPERVEVDLARGGRSALFPLVNTTLEIREADGADDSARSGLAGLRLRCDDLEKAAHELAARGVETGAPVAGEAKDATDGAVRRWRAMTVAPGASRGLPVELVSADPDERPVRGDRDGSRTGGGEAASAGGVRALDHVVILSADADATRDFYGGALGIRLALDRSFEGRGVRLLFFRTGGVTIEIGSRLDATPRPDAIDRFGGLAWQVPDVDAIRARLAADRFDVSEVRDGHKPGTRVCTVRASVHDVPTLLIQPVD
jgi:catechol 2,3-dioxygenase-like lactoylglutathione lyase family enzyme